MADMIANTRHKDYKYAMEEYREWGMILLKMRIDPKFNDMMPYNRKDVIERRKELLKMAAVLKTKGWGNEVKESRAGRVVELGEFDQEDVYVGESVRRWVYK